MVPPDAPPGEAADFKIPYTTVMIIDDKKKIRLQQIYPTTTGIARPQLIAKLEG
jgi:alkyl hydroperoxide reductase subunit AhpC